MSWCTIIALPNGTIKIENGEFYDPGGKSHCVCATRCDDLLDARGASRFGNVGLVITRVDLRVWHRNGQLRAEYSFKDGEHG